MRFLVFLLLLFSVEARSECFVVGEFKGYGLRQNESFEFNQDGMSRQKFMLDIDGENSKGTPSNMECLEAGHKTVLCLGAVPDTAAIETWAVYPDKGIAIFTKTRNGVNVFNGGMLFKGSILGKCGK